MSRILLRAMIERDLPLLTGGDSEFDDWGHTSGPRTAVAPSDTNAAGGLTIADAETDNALGSVTWHWVRWGPNPESTNPMIGIWLARNGRGRGLGTRAQQQLVDLLFSQTQTNRIEAHTDIANVAEQKALARTGFAQEGIIRGAQWRRGAFHDGYLYSILRSEWTASLR